MNAKLHLALAVLWLCLGAFPICYGWSFVDPDSWVVMPLLLLSYFALMASLGNLAWASCRIWDK